ncbi:MAG TPA: hypothetical protein DDW30_02995 [Clostridiales bacterium]|nr:hypothetical protein [Clostridiales bacterium]
MMTERLERGAERLRRAAGESVLLNAFFHGTRAEQNAVQRPARNTGGRRASLRFRVMRWQETSVARRALNALWSALLRSSVGSLAGVPFGAAASALILYFWRGGTDFTAASVTVPAIVLLSVLPAVGEERSLSDCLRHGRLTAPFLFGFCGLSPDRFGAGETVGVRRRATLPAGLAVGALSLVLPPLVLPLFAGTVCLWFLCRAVPELSALFLALSFPFLPLLPHTTALLACGVALSLAVFCGKWLSGRRDFRFEEVDRLAAAFAAVYLLAGGAAGAVSALFVFGGWSTFRSMSGQWRRRALGGLVFSASLCACIGILEYASGRAALRWVDMTRFSDIGGRVCATFENPNILAVLLLAVYPVALCGTRRFASRTARRFCGAGAALLAGCTVLTWSRGAWLGMLAETVLFLLLTDAKSLTVLFCLPLPAVAVLPYLPHSVTNRFVSIGCFAESSIRYRLEVWRGIARMIAANPFGIGTREADFRRFWQGFAVSGTETVMHAHALFPQVALETGLAGAALLAVFLFCLTRTFRPHGWSVAGFAALGGLLLMGLFDHLWYARGMLWLMFAVLALIPQAGEEDV